MTMRGPVARRIQLTLLLAALVFALALAGVNL